MLRALDERDSLPAAIGSLWRFEGPQNQRSIVNDSSGEKGIQSGRINDIAIDPGNPQIMYATGAGGGLWKTTDGGVTWAARSKGWKIQAATAVALDPNNANRVYVGTGDFKRLDHMEPFSVGVMRSLDGGLTWGQRGTEQMREFTVSRIVVDPSTSALGLGASQVILAATGRGSRLPGGQVFRSADGGVTWASVGLPDANWDDLELDHDHIFWAAATRRHDLDNPVNNSATPETGLLFRSKDGGVTWGQVNIGTLGVNAFSLSDPANHPDTIQIA